MSIYCKKITFDTEVHFTSDVLRLFVWVTFTFLFYNDVFTWLFTFHNTGLKWVILS